MADLQQQLQQLQPQPAPLRPARRALVGRLAAGVANHGFLALALIVVLAVLVVGLYVYYHGFLFLGPYAAAAGGPRKGRPPGAKAPPAEEKGDAETERLIESINRQ